MSQVGIFILAYEVARTLIAAYERIPAPLKKEAAEIYILDDASNDNTFWAGMGYKLLHNIPNLNVYRNPRNLGKRSKSAGIVDAISASRSVIAAF